LLSVATLIGAGASFSSVKSALPRNCISHNPTLQYCGRRFSHVTVNAVPALLIQPRCTNKNEQKHLEIPLSEKKVPTQNEVFQNLINRKISCFSVKLIPAQVQANLWKNPGAKSAKTPQHPCWERFCALDVAVPEATRGGEREAPCGARSLGKRHGPILDRLLWSVLTASHPCR